MRVRGLLSASFLFLCCGGLHHGAVGKFPAVQVQCCCRARETRYIHIASHGQAPHGIRITAPNSHSTFAVRC